MIANIYCVFDVKAGVGQMPFFMANDDLAVRSFMLAVVAADGPMSSFPEHYTLMRLGTWNDNKMIIEGENAQSVMNGLEAVARMQGREAQSPELYRVEKTNGGNDEVEE